MRWLRAFARDLPIKSLKLSYQLISDYKLFAAIQMRCERIQVPKISQLTTANHAAMVKTSGKKRSAKELEAEAGAEAGAEQKLAAGPDPDDDDGGEHDGDNDSSSSSDEEDDDLVLEGEVIRPAGIDSSDEELSSEEEDNNAVGKKPRKIPLPEDYVESKKKTTNKSDMTTGKSEEKKPESKNEQKKGKGGKNKGKSKSTEPTVNKVNVDFIFCDMDEKFFFGIKTLLLSNPTLAPQSSALADLMVENVSVGTVISAEGYTDGDDDVFGYASVLNVTTNGSHPCIQYLKKQCLDHCPVQHREELETVLSGKTKRPAGFLIHGRYVSSNPLLLYYLLCRNTSTRMQSSITPGQCISSHNIFSVAILLSIILNHLG